MAVVEKVKTELPPLITPLKDGYETTFITRVDISDAVLQSVKDRITQIIKSFEGECALIEDWGKKKLAYPIQKETRGQYTYFVYTGRRSIVAEIERYLRLQDFVLRFLTVHLHSHFSPSEFIQRRAEIKAAAKKREEERELHREEKNAERRGGGSYEERTEYRRHNHEEETIAHHKKENQKQIFDDESYE